jgi:hypothetical protein
LTATDTTFRASSLGSVGLVHLATEFRRTQQTGTLIKGSL